MLVLSIVALIFTSTLGQNDCGAVIDAHYPSSIVSFFTPVPPSLDGMLDEPVWAQVDWSTDFVDINTTIAPEFRTRFKVRHDRSHLYFAVEISDAAVWANITYCCHCFNNSEDQVIFHGNDIEVFVDPAGSCQFYKETELNAANQYWDLCLNKPYENGGYENSSRVFGKEGFEMFPRLKTATRALGCSLNVPSASCRGWVAEFAFPLVDLMYNNTSEFPTNGTVWRLNLSRVEWGVRPAPPGSPGDCRYWLEPHCQSCPWPGAPTMDNWVFSPMGVVDVHRPELWGFLEFRDGPPVRGARADRQLSWPARYAAHVLYYAEVAYAIANGGIFTDCLASVLPFASHPGILNGCPEVKVTELTARNDTWSAVLVAREGPRILINQDRFIRQI